MEKVPTGGLCAVFPQWYLAGLLTGITSPHRLCLIYLLRPSKLQQQLLQEQAPFFRNYFAILSVGYRVSTYHLALQEPQAAHFDFLIWPQFCPCPDMFAFLFSSSCVCSSFSVEVFSRKHAICSASGVAILSPPSGKGPNSN